MSAKEKAEEKAKREYEARMQKKAAEEEEARQREAERRERELREAEEEARKRWACAGAGAGGGRGQLVWHRHGSVGAHTRRQREWVGACRPARRWPVRVAVACAELRHVLMSSSCPCWAASAWPPGACTSAESSPM